MNKLFKENKKGQVLGQMTSLVIGLVMIGIVLTVGFLIMAETQDQIVDTGSVNESDASTYTIAYNASRTTQNATSDIPTWLSIIVITVIGAALIGLVKRFG